MKKGFLVAIILIAVLTCAFALVACGESTTGVSTTVTYMLNGEVFETVTVTNAHQSDPGFTPSKSGYTFGGWYTDTALLTPFDFEAYAANKERTNIAVYAKWEVNTYNITYENTKGAANSNPATYNIESEITLFGLTSPGYTFEGWFAGEEKVESIELGSYGDITLTAKWAVITYTATFVNSDGTVGTVDFDIEDTALSEPAVPQRTGYTGAWEAYEIKAENMTINAVYTPITYNITYENTKGAANGNPATYTVEDAAVALQDAAKTGYTFLGWYSDAEFAQEVSEIDTSACEDVELWARWEVITYTAAFVNSDGTVGTVGFDIEDTALSEPAVPQRTGYTGEWEDYEIKAENLMINAVYTPITYNITYENTKGAANNNPATYNIETATITLADITSPGYTFEGWYTDETFEEQVDFISEGSFGDLELFAKWTPTEYSVNYVLDGGINNSANPSSYSLVTLGGADGVISIEAPTKSTNDVSVNADGTFTRHAYEFLGWYKDSGFEQRVSELSLALGSVTLYAKWADMPTEVSANYVRVNENNELDEDGGYILFGQYPQTIKAANVSIISTTPDTDGYYLGSDGERYAKKVAYPYGSSYTFSDNSNVTRGNTYYFKVEPIRWRILSESDGNAFILCDSIIANHNYHHTTSSTTIDGQKVYANNYKYSDIRAWLNDEFYNTAFGALQQALIQTTEVDNSGYSTGYPFNRYACENTSDKVFLLSYREVITIKYTARQMLTSDFSRATGAYMSTDSSYYYGNGQWWLRSPYYDYVNNARSVGVSGTAVNYGSDVDFVSRGVVPALKLTLS